MVLDGLSIYGRFLDAPTLDAIFPSNPNGYFTDRYNRPVILLDISLIFFSDLATAAVMTLLPLVISRCSLGIWQAVAESRESGVMADLTGKSLGVRVGVLEMQ